MEVMISMPMNGKSNEDIRKEMKPIKDEFAKLHISVVDSLFDNYDNKYYNNIALYYIAKSIDLIGKVDAVYFVDGWRQSRGCRIERKICEEYGIKILDENFLFPKKSIERRDNVDLFDSYKNMYRFLDNQKSKGE